MLSLRVLLALSLASAASASAQVATRRVELASHDTAAQLVDPGATVSTALRVTNRAQTRVTLTPSVIAPANWSVPLGTLAFALDTMETDSWIVSVRVPARAPAGNYTIAVSATDQDGQVVVKTSFTVSVRAQRGLELAMTNRPTYSISGDTYKTAFLLQNRGNVSTDVTLTAVSSTGSTIGLDASRISLGAGESQPIIVRASATVRGQEARDDVVELRAIDAADTTVDARASALVTIVQRANMAEPLHRVASQLRVRAAAASAGVSPFELVGGGALRDGGTEQINFVMRGPTGPSSQFGDREEYRVSLSGANYKARLGDDLYRISNLTSIGQAGFGAGLDITNGSVRAGAYSQRFRYQPDATMESGAYVSTQADNGFGKPLLTLSGVSRSGGLYSGTVLGSSAMLHPFDGSTMELELAASTGPRGRGVGRTARLSGGSRVRYDLEHTAADDNFAGIARGAEHDYASVAVRPSGEWQVSAATGVHQSNGFVQGLFAPQNYRVSSLQVENSSRYSLQYSTLTRTSGVSLLHQEEAQHGLLARAEESFGVTRFFGSVGVGTASTAPGHDRRYHELSIGGSTSVGANTISVYGETSEGMTITRGADRLVTVGGDLRLQLAQNTLLTVNGFQTSVPSMGDKYTQVDAGISQALSTGATVSLRLRVAGNNNASVDKQVAFIEYAMPLQMPVGRSRQPGRVRGRVVDQETGHGIAGTLVRLGPQAAITDSDGRVAFAGLPAGEYRVSIAQQMSQASTVFTGDPTVVVEGARRVPTTFALTVERAGVVTGSVRLMTVARTGIDASPDSLADAGPMEGITVALVGARDTAFARSDAAGSFRFAEVTSGSWILKVITEAQAGTKWEPSEIDVDVKPGVKRSVSVRQVPRRRAVQMIPGDAPTVRK